MDQIRQGQLKLSAQLDFEFEPVAPPGDIADLVNSFYLIRSDAVELDEIIPAFSPQILIFVEGGAELRPGGSRRYPTATVCCSTQLLQASPVRFNGPTWILGASLSALGWQALSAMPADEVNNQLVDGERVFEPQNLNALEDLARRCGGGDATPTMVFQKIAEIMRTCRDRLTPSHVRIVGTVMAWLASDLSPPISDLYNDVGVSQRTVQRVTRRYFGVSPMHLVKRVRAIRAAMLLANPDLPQAMRDAIVDAYFDQAHLIRDIRRYTGRTPTRLSDGSIFGDMLDPQAHGNAARLLRE